MAKRPATLEEARALAHPLRLRILRLCLDEELTNKQLAERLELDPGTTNHHVRTLVETGFLAAGAPRSGARGALEKPYRATGKSWTLDVSDSPEELNSMLAMVDAFRAELFEAGEKSVETFVRLGATLERSRLDEFVGRVDELVKELAARPPDTGGIPVSVFVGVHRQEQRRS